MDQNDLVRFLIAVISGVISGVCITYARKWKARAEYAIQEYLRITDVLNLMEQAQGASRDVQFRLAATMEAEILRTDRDAPSPGDLPRRRAAAVLMATNVLESIRRANMTVTINDDV